VLGALAVACPVSWLAAGPLFGVGLIVVTGVLATLAGWSARRGQAAARRELAARIAAGRETVRRQEIERHQRIPHGARSRGDRMSVCSSARTPMTT